MDTNTESITTISIIRDHDKIYVLEQIIKNQATNDSIRIIELIISNLIDSIIYSLENNIENNI